MRLRLIIVIYCITALYLSFNLRGQSISTVPFTTHYLKITYDAGYQNWDIVQDNRGVIYFANNNGLLQFNNKSWRCYPLPNNTILRSLAIDTSGHIYAGGQNIFGFYYPDEKGEWLFHSLKEKIPEGHKNFEDVWETLISEEFGIFFMTSNKLFLYTTDTIKVFEPSGLFNYIGVLGDRCIVQDNKKGLCWFNGDSLQSIKGSNIFKSGPITGFLDLKNGKYLIVTLKYGIYETDGKYFKSWGDISATGLFREHSAYSSAILKDGRIAIGTALNGLYICNKQGKILQHVNASNGLGDNNVLCIMVDKSQNLWLGLENGIDYIHTNSPFSRISSDKKIEGAGYDIEILNNEIYFGTSKRVYYTKFDSRSYSPVYQTRLLELSNIKGQVWGFNIIDNRLLLGHHDGGYLIDKLELTKISPRWGVWLFQQLRINKDYVLVGTYTGLSLYRKTNRGLRFEHDIAGFKESSRFVEQDNRGNIWISHPYKGIFKLVLNENLDSVSVRKYGKDDGLYSDLSNFLFRIQGEIIFCSSKGIYTYNENEDKFDLYPMYNDILGADTKVIRLYEATSGDIWYVTTAEVGVLEVTEKSLTKEINNITYPGIKKLMVNGFEMIYPFDDNNVYIGAENGFIHLDPHKTIDTSEFLNVVFDEISLTSGTKEDLFLGAPLIENLASGNMNTSQVKELQAKQNSLFFSFATTDYSNPEINQFRYYLEGLEKEWSPWTSKSDKEYTHLRPGEYVFNVHARNKPDSTTPVSSFHFVILPPWYLSKLAYVIYFLLIIGSIVWIGYYLWSKYMFQKKKVIVTEKQVKQLKEERLQTELNFKNRELISASLHIGHKDTILSKIEREIQKIVEKANDTDFSNQLRQLIRMIRNEEGIDKEIRQFSKLFNEIHPGFLDRIKSEYPELSSKDLKICSYIRMNMSTKEIASISNMTIRGVEGSRYRLRKKLKLSKDTDLASFILYF